MLRHFPLVVCFLLLAGPAAGQGADKAHSRQERAAIAQRLAADEAACYQKFAVNDCLRRAREQARSEQAALQLHDNAAARSERLERSAKHKKSLQDKRAAAAAQAPGLPAAGPGGARAPHSNPQAPRASQAAQAAEALAERAAQHRARETQAARAHQRLMDKQEAAAAREKARARRQAQREANGSPMAAPLPDPH